MGCGSSQQTQAQDPIDEQITKPVESKIKSTARVYPTTASVIQVEAAQTKSKNKNQPELDSAVASRNSSAVSSTSQKSSDSGVAVQEPLILEPASPKDPKQQTEAMKLSDLFVNRGPSGKTRSVDEAEIIEKLRSEGLISRPKSVASGMSFEIAVEEQTVASRRLPPRLQRLELVQEEKKVVTENDIKDKLAKAAERRKKKLREAASALPPRAVSRAATVLDSPIPETEASHEQYQMPLVHTSHPESEPLRPPTIVHFEDAPSPVPVA